MGMCKWVHVRLYEYVHVCVMVRVCEWWHVHLYVLVVYFADVKVTVYIGVQWGIEAKCSLQRSNRSPPGLGESC